MMPNINISQETYDDLKGLAEPFVDHDPEDVIKRLIAHMRSSAVSGEVDYEPSAIKTYAADSPPDMAFTRVKSFTMNGEPVVEKSNLWWNPILFAMVAKAAKVLGADKLKKNLLVNYVDGVGQQDRGYRFIKEAGISVQGSDTNTVWKAIYQLSRAMGAKIEVDFVWEDKPKAAYPNRSGHFQFDGK